MKQDYYSLPLRFDELIKKKTHGLCTLRDSIAQHLHVILTTHLNESRFDPEYGCNLWDFDFQMVPDPKENKYRWKESIRSSFENTIRKSEKRLSKVKVRIDIEDYVEDYKVSRKVQRKIRKRLLVHVESVVSSTNEDFTFDEHMFIAPFSAD